MQMMDEDLVLLTEAGPAFPAGQNPSMPTLHRWRTKGIGGVVLETMKIGGARYTSRQAIQRFIAAQNAKGR